MRSAEEVLRQVAMDEIIFDGGQGPVSYTRESFGELCKIWRGKGTGVSVATLEPALRQLRAAYRFGDKGTFQRTYDQWADQFFSFMSIIRFGSIYEVNAAIKRHRDQVALSVSPSPKRS